MSFKKQEILWVIRLIFFTQSKEDNYFLLITLSSFLFDQLHTHTHIFILLSCINQCFHQRFLLLICSCRKKKKNFHLYFSDLLYIPHIPLLTIRKFSCRLLIIFRINQYSIDFRLGHVYSFSSDRSI